MQIEPGLIGHQRLHALHRFTRAAPFGRAALDLHRRQAVETLLQLRPTCPVAAGKAGERGHLAVAATHVPLADVVGHAAVRLVALHVHTLDPAAIQEIIDVAATPGGRQRGIDVGLCQAQRAGLGVVDVQPQLGLVAQPVQSHGGQSVVFAGRAYHLLLRGLQRYASGRAGVLQPQFETAGLPEAAHCRRRQHVDLGIEQFAEIGIGARDDRRCGVVALALVPGLECQEALPRILAGTGVVATDHHEHHVQVLLLVLHEVTADLLAQRLGARHRRAFRRGELEGHLALVLHRQEAGGHACVQGNHGDHQQQVERHPAPRTGHHATELALVGRLAAVDATVERGEEAPRWLLRRRGLEQGRAQCWCQGQRDQRRQRHGRCNRDRELPVDDAGGTAEQRHRQEHRTEHHGDADQRTGDLAHRLLGCLAWRQMLFVDDAFHVLHHHDRVIDQQADGQHHRKQRQGVDGETGHREDAEGTQQHHRHRDRRNQGGAQVLQEQEHHHHDQYDRLDEGVDDPFDGDPYERRAVAWIGHLQPGRERRPQPFKLRAYCIGSGQRVGAGGQGHRETRSRIAVEEAAGLVILRADLDPRNVAQVHRRAAGQRAQDDRAELFRSLQARLRGDGGIEALRRTGRQRPQLAGSDLGVLCLDRAAYIRRHQVVGTQLVRIQPHPHRIGRTEHIDLADAGNAADRVLHVADQEIGNVHPLHAPAGVVQRNHHQRVALRLGHGHTLLLHFLRQAVDGLVDAVLHLYLGDIGVGALVEGDRDPRLPRRRTGGGKIEQVVDALDLLFDHLGDAVFHRLCRRAGVVGGDVDLRRCDVRVLLDRQLGHRNRAERHDADRQYPGEYGAVDEEARQHALSPFRPAQSRAPSSSAPACRRQGPAPPPPPPARQR